MEQIDDRGTIITLVHFVYEGVPESVDQSGQPKGGDRTFMRNNRWIIACMPNMTEFHQTQFHPSYHRTNDPRAVNCPACMNTDAYKHMRALNA